MKTQLDRLGDLKGKTIKNVYSSYGPTGFVWAFNFESGEAATISPYYDCDGEPDLELLDVTDPDEQKRFGIITKEEHSQLTKEKRIIEKAVTEKTERAELARLISKYGIPK